MSELHILRITGFGQGQISTIRSLAHFLSGQNYADIITNFLMKEKKDNRTFYVYLLYLLQKTTAHTNQNHISFYYYEVPRTIV
jgi:hypothetical protein